MKCLSILILPLVCASAYAADAKSEVQAKYNELSAAFANRDPKTFDQLLAKDYVLHLGSQTRDRADILKDFQRQMGSMKNVKWRRKVTDLKQVGDQYVVTVKSVFDGDFEVKGKQTHFWNSAVSKDTWWQGPDKKWELKSSDLVSLDAKLDGKPAGHFPQK